MSRSFASGKAFCIFFANSLFLNSINFFLRRYLISVIDIKKKRLNFNSRYDEKERIYQYKIINRFSSLTIDKNKAWHIKKKLDVNLLKKESTTLMGTHDCSNIRSSS